MHQKSYYKSHTNYILYKLNIFTLSHLSNVFKAIIIYTKYRTSQKMFTCLAGNGIKSMKPILKTDMLIYQSKANLDEKILFGKIIHHSGKRQVWK